MHIVVVGAGALGTLYGGWLMAAGASVSFVARGARLDQLLKSGLTLEGKGSSYQTPVTSAAARASALPPADILIFCVKLYDLAEAAAQSTAALAPGGLVVGLQNGVDGVDLLNASFPPQQVMVGPAYSAAKFVADGAVHFSGARNDIVIGNVDGIVHRHAEQLLSLWRKAGVKASIADDIHQTIWTKFLAFGTNAALTCLSRQPAGVVYHDPDLLALARRSIGEIFAVAAAEGVVLPASAPAQALALLQGFPPDLVASMRQDLDAGRRLELDGVSGAIVRLGRKHGIETPLHEAAYACLKPYQNGSARRSPINATA